MKTTVKEICEKIWDIEEKYELNHMEIQGTYPWQLIRVYTYYEIARKLGVFQSAQQASVSKSDKVKSLTPFIKNSLLYNPSSGKEKEILIFDHPRKVMFKDEYCDIYSYFLPKTLDVLNYSYELIESPYLNKHYTNRRKKKDKNGKKYIKYNDKILLESYVHKTKNRGKVPFTKEELKKIDKIEKAIENSFSDINQGFILTMDLFRIIEDHILNFQYEYEKYQEVFDKKKPKQIFVVVAYENKAVVAAAKSKGIEVIELQHGTISPYHLGYSYPKRTMLKDGKVKEIEYFPDKILTFGDYWNNACTYPIESENLITMGFPYFEENSKEYQYMMPSSDKTQVLFISQGVIGKYLSKFAYDLSLSLLDESLLTVDKDVEDSTINKSKEYEIIYKLHPGEYETWRENYPHLLETKNLCENTNVSFKVIDDNITPLYELFAKSEYQIGAFSTAIYEGLSFNCKTFVINVPGIEYLDDLIDKQIVRKVNNIEPVLEELKSKTEKESNNKNSHIFRKIDKDYLFKPYDESIFYRILK